MLASWLPISADAPHADDAHRLAAELGAEAERAFDPLTGAHVTVALDKAPGNSKGQRHAEIGDAVRQHARRVGDGHAARRLERVLTNDPASGVMRHADAGYDIAIECAREYGLKLPMLGNDQ